MDSVVLEYNPYLKEINLKLNGEPFRQESRLKQVKSGYLQNWLSSFESGNGEQWNGLAVELAKAINDDFSLTFIGRAIDFDDIEIAFKEADLGKFECILNSPEIINADMISLQRMNEVVDELQNGPFEELKRDDLYQQYLDAQEAVFEVNVIATMSSGKSTVLNAMLGRELLPSKNEACTATVARIMASNELDCFEAECRDEGERIIYPRKKVIDKDLDQYNDDDKVHYIDLYGPVSTLQSDKMQLRLVDTPGPNNSRVKAHGEITRSIIQDMNSSMVIYILNATQLGIRDDKETFQDIAKMMNAKGMQAQDRVLFVLNKCDVLDPEDDEALPTVIANARDLLKDYGIEKAKIIPVTAYTARLIRQIQCGETLTRKEQRDLEGYIKDCLQLPLMHFEQYADISPSCKKQIEEMLQNAKTDEEKVLIHSGIPALELSIREYLDKYAYPMKLEDARRAYNIKIKGIMQNQNYQAKLIDNENERKKLQDAAEQLKAILDKGKEERTNDVKNEVQKIKLDYDELDDLLLTLYDIEEKLAVEYEGVTEMDEKVAENFLERFLERMNSEVNNLLGRMQKMSVVTLDNASSQIFDIYNHYIKELNLENLQLSDDYDLGIALQMKDIAFGSSQEMIDQYINQYSYQQDIMEKRTEIVSETYLARNPKKKWWAFWRTETIEKTRDVKKIYVDKIGEKTVVDVQTTLREIQSKYRKQVKNRYDTQREKINYEFEKMRDEMLTIQMKRLEHELYQIALEWEELSNKRNQTEQEIAKINADLEWITDIEDKLENAFIFK